LSKRSTRSRASAEQSGARNDRPKQLSGSFGCDTRVSLKLCCSSRGGDNTCCSASSLRPECASLAVHWGDRCLRLRTCAPASTCAVLGGPRNGSALSRWWARVQVDRGPLGLPGAFLAVPAGFGRPTTPLTAWQGGQYLYNNLYKRLRGGQLIVVESPGGSRSPFGTSAWLHFVRRRCQGHRPAGTPKVPWPSRVRRAVRTRCPVIVPLRHARSRFRLRRHGWRMIQA
jgi:hypothetical protein